MASPAAPARAPRLAFRADIEGLRAIAVALVVLLHAGVTEVSGGYVGVDVFFVISGFLITSLLIDEVTHTGRVSVLAFYARRARRILPAACLVITVTVLAVYDQLGPLVGTRTAVDGVWAAFFVANFRFISEGADYFARALPPSALQHYWSLAVEEQFYLVWPSLLFGLVLLGRRAGRTTTTLRIGLLVVVLGSLLWSVHQSAVVPTTAYFSPFTRAWELGAGALIAVFSGEVGRAHPAVRAAATWVGLVLVAIAAFAFTSATMFPGYAALLPVCGGGLIIAGGIGRPIGGVTLLLGLAPLRWLGRISFSLYLWHWPILVIAEQRATAPLSGVARAACVALAVALSVASYYLVERPLHATGILKAVNARTEWQGARKALLVGALTITVAVGASLLVHDRAATAITGAARSTAGPAVLADGLGPHASTADRIAAFEARVEANVREGLALHHVPDDVQPPVFQIRTAIVPKYVQCMQGQAGVAPRSCTFGDRESSRTLVVLGDSHAMQWMPALDRYGRTRGYRVLTLYKEQCPVPTVDVMVPPASGAGAQQPYPQCSSWRERALHRIRAIRPDAVVLAFNQTFRVLRGGAAEQAKWLDGLRTSVRQLQASGARVVEIGANPGLPEDSGLCLSRPNADPTSCPARYLSRSLTRAELEVMKAMGGAAIDTEPLLCVQQQCPVIIGRRIAYADDGHLSAQYVSYVEPLLAMDLRLSGLR